MKKAIAGLAIAVSLTGCSRAGSNPHAFEWSAELPAGAVVHLRNGAGDIHIKRASDQTARVIGGTEWRKGRERDVKFVVTRNGNDYYICAMWRNSGKCGTGPYRGRNTRSLLSMLSLFNRSSDATAEFEVELPAHVAVDARNTLGDVTIEGITGGVSARTVQGDVEAVDVAGKIDLHTTNGDVEFSAEPTASLDAVTLISTNGDINAELPPGAEGIFDIVTTNGDARSDLPLLAEKRSHGHRLRGQIGTSTRTVQARSVNGSVVIATRGVSTTHRDHR